MTEPLDRYDQISEGFDSRLHGVGDDQWAAPTPCPDWDVRALVTHLIGSHHAMLSTLGQAHDAPQPDGDLVAAWHDARAAVLGALRDPSVADTTVQSPFGEMTFAQLVGGLLCGDTLFHTWDLARATGQDETLDASQCAEQLQLMLPVDDLIRSPGFFGPKLDPPADADAQTSLLCFGGRRP